MIRKIRNSCRKAIGSIRSKINVGILEICVSLPVKYVLSTARIQAVLKIMCGAKSQYRSAGSFGIILRLNRLISVYELRSGCRNHHGYEEKAY